MLLANTVLGDGPPVVLLHGILGSRRSWAGVASLLQDDHRVVTVDLLGFGASPRPTGIDELWADRQAGAVLATMDSLGIGSATVVGHDFGGPVSVALAARAPERVDALVLAAANLFPDTPIPMPIRAVTWPLAGAPVARILFSGPSLGLMLRTVSGDAPVDRAAALGDPGQQRTIRTIFAHALRELRARYAPLQEALGAIACPATVLWGDSDPFFGPRLGARTAQAIPGARLVMLPGAGHFLPEERPHAFAEAVRALTPVAG